MQQGDVFGQPLAKATPQGKELPAVLDAIFSFFGSLNGAPQDLFSMPWDSQQVFGLRSVVAQYNGYGNNPLASAPYQAVAGLLICYLRMLPQPIVPILFYNTFLSIGVNTSATTRAFQLRVFYSKLGQSVRSLLYSLFDFLNRTRLPPESYVFLFANAIARQGNELSDAQPDQRLTSIIAESVQQSPYINYSTDSPSTNDPPSSVPEFEITVIALYDFQCINLSYFLFFSFYLLVLC